jgi:hypothetical protein
MRLTVEAERSRFTMAFSVEVEPRSYPRDVRRDIALRISGTSVEVNEV